MKTSINSRSAVLKRLFEHMDGKVSGADTLTWLADHGFLNMSAVHRSFDEVLFDPKAPCMGAITVDDNLFIRWNEHVQRTDENDPLSPNALMTTVTLEGKMPEIPAPDNNPNANRFAATTVSRHPDDKPDRQKAIAIGVMKIIGGLWSFGAHGSAEKFYERIINGKCKDCRAVKLMAEGTPIYKRFFEKGLRRSDKQDLRALDKDMLQKSMTDALQAEISTEVSKA